ncbi:MAG: GYD domain-containing protein [Nitrospirae bacterium]|nr:GYD domain-containing protein [Candidatus Manganitrophaceae bacterium]
MATYIMLSTITDDGSKTLYENPSRLKEVNKEIEGMGVKVIGQYATLGPYDFVNIIEAPDNETVARLSVALGARGSVRLLTLPAIPIEKFISTLGQKK